MKVVERFFPCFIRGGKGCVQPPERWGECGRSEANGELSGCGHTIDWFRGQFGRARLGSEVEISVDPKDPTIIVGQSDTIKFVIRKGINSDSIPEKTK